MLLQVALAAFAYHRGRTDPNSKPHTMPDHPDSSRRLAALHAAVTEIPAFRGIEPKALEPAGFTGMAHDHIRIRGRGVILRVPRVSQWGLAAHINLAYQTACFRRAEPSGHTPRLAAVLPPSVRLPMGALLVEEITGRKPRLPGDLPAIARCLNAVHGLALPAPAARRPLLAPKDPLAHLLGTIELQASFLDRARLAREAAAQIREELDWARRFVATPPRAPMPRRLIVTDSHPGNFVIHPSGKAYFVDLEKAMYALPAIDLAHATLYTSTRFDPDVDAVLSPAETRAFYRDYLAGAGRRAAAALRPWLAPLRRLVWLRTTTWCVKWRVESRGEDGWSRRWLEARMRRHMERCLADFFAPATIARVRAEWAERDAEAIVL